MAQTQPFKAVVAELTKYGFKIYKRPEVEFIFSKPEYRKEPFQEPGPGDECEILQWTKDKKDANKIWVSSIAVLNGHDNIPDDIFGDEVELNNSRVKQSPPQAPQPPPVGKYPTKEAHSRLDRKITLLTLHKSLAPTLIQVLGMDNPRAIWDTILQHEAMLNAALDREPEV